jgi:type VI secretion system secreted protein VgrG
MVYTQENLYFAVDTPLGENKLLLKHFHGEEGISRLFHFGLEMQSEDRNLDFSKIVGQSATVTVQLADDTERFINGIVGRFVQAGTDKVLTTYHAELYPWLWLLTMETNCRIFQNKTVPQIIETVFSDLGFSDYRTDLKGSFEPRDYCVQYNESAFDFVSRLMEDEGIFYFFEHDKGVHTLVMADDLSAFPDCPGAKEVRYGTLGQHTEQNSIIRCTVEENVISSAFAHNDYNFETPSTDLTATIDSTIGSNGLPRRIYEFPGGFLKKDAGDERAKLRIEEQETTFRTLQGESYSRPFTAGHKFELKEHYRSDLNASWVLRQVSHSGLWDGYTNSFTAFPADVPFRPPRTTKKPVIPGTQTAVVVGKAGEEIWTDQFGRVKVQFFWDQEGKRDENSSCWVRVAQAWAGKAWGFIAIPRIGQEVVVSFVEGDPDRPLITGSVYNAEQTVPNGLPGAGTQSGIRSNSSKGGGGSNEIRLEDAKGGEEIFIHAQKDENIVVENDKTEKVNHDETITIANDRTETVQHDEKLTVDNDRTRNVGSNETVGVGKNQGVSVGGDRTDSVTGNETRSVGKDQKLSVEANRSATVAKDDSLQVGKNLSIQAGDSITIQATNSITISVGKSSITAKKDGTISINGKDISLDGSGKITGKAAGDMVLKAKKILQN